VGHMARAPPPPPNKRRGFSLKRFFWCSAANAARLSRLVVVVRADADGGAQTRVAQHAVNGRRDDEGARVVARDPRRVQQRVLKTGGGSGGYRENA